VRLAGYKRSFLGPPAGSAKVRAGRLQAAPSILATSGRRHSILEGRLAAALVTLMPEQ